MKGNIISLLTGANRIFRQTHESIKSSGADYIERNIIHGKYVSREEYEQLLLLVKKLQKQILDLKDSTKNN